MKYFITVSIRFHVQRCKMMESSARRKGNEVKHFGKLVKRFGGMSVWIGMSIKQSIMVSVSIRA